MDENILNFYYPRWKNQMEEAYAMAQAGISNEIEGKLTELHYPLEVGEDKGRIPRVKGTPTEVEVEKFEERQKDFGVRIAMESGRKFIDPEAIVVLEKDYSDEDSDWKKPEEQLPPRDMSKDEWVSEKVEVFTKSRERDLDRYSFENNSWLENEVRFWKKLGRGPNVINSQKQGSQQ